MGNDCPKAKNTLIAMTSSFAKWPLLNSTKPGELDIFERNRSVKAITLPLARYNSSVSEPIETNNFGKESGENL